jgi:hypothetical protein
MNGDKVLIGVLTVFAVMLVTIFTYLAYTIDNKVTETNNKIELMNLVLERYQLFNRNINFSETYNGVAYGDQMYSVWTKNRTAEEIEDTDMHERCHVLISKSNENKVHFCG